MLVLVVFGYFYTVRPVYQRDLLEEQTAKLQLEQDSLRKRNSESVSRPSHSEKLLSDLTEKRAILEEQISELNDKHKQSQVELGALRQASAISKAELNRLTSLNKTQDKQIVESQVRMFTTSGSWLLAARYLNDDLRNVFIKADPAEVEKWALSSQDQPIDQALTAIDGQLETGNPWTS